jgi:hypothetical protein
MYDEASETNRIFYIDRNTGKIKAEGNLIDNIIHYS